MRTLLISLFISLLTSPISVVAEVNASNQSIEECTQAIKFRPYTRKNIDQLTVVYSQSNYHLIGVEEANSSWWVIIKTNPCEVLMMDAGGNADTFRGIVPDEVVEGMELAAIKYSREFHKKLGN